ncbi:putative aldouronate transport system substrate-binding protein [Paenibacillus algorifonticola]|uniref:Putative aldouronate transport system substrate-binding protein n=1 Tax=Paenibacillus algorifonticola TaxID=684063 RepID=A0A1I2GS65_9BACL|nr:extracellular solute-binding protein [Paenibacillus algorifonticola]SFF20774.1 putative aldouronate transport system substrate-binding protein [Paenibacillus algorifonticola]
MKNRKRLIVAAMLSMTLVATACSNGAGSETNAPSQSNAPDKEETIVLTINPSTWSIPTNDDNEIQKYVEEKYNVKIVNMRATDENFKVKVSAGEIPDIFPHNISEGDMVNYARQGVIASISVDEIKQYMPTYTADVETVDPNAWDIGFYDGKNWGVPRVWLNGSYGFIPTYNGAWLKAIGYNEAPKTLEEYEDVVYKFRNNDPDRNGQKDTYAFTTRGTGNQQFNEIYAAYGVNPYQFMLADDGTVTWGGLSDQAKEALKLLQKWYKDGVLDPEFLTDNNDTITQKWNNKKIGILDHNMYHHLFNQIETNKANGIEPVYGKGLIGPAGKSLAMSNGALQVPLLFGAQVEKDEKKMIKILQILEDLVSNDDAYLKTAFGLEGVSYELKDGAAEALEPYKSNNDKVLELGYGGYYNPLVERSLSMWKYHFSPAKMEFRETLNEGIETISDLLGPTPLEAKSKYSATLNPLQDEYYVKAIIGTDHIDKTFEEFKQNWLKSGGEEMLEEATKVYQERQTAK